MIDDTNLGSSSSSSPGPGPGSNHQDNAVYNRCQAVTQNLNSLTQALQQYSTRSLEASEVDFPSDFRDRAKALLDQVNQLEKQLTATADTIRLTGLFVKKRALGRELQRAMQHHRHHRQDQIRNDLRIYWPDMSERDTEEIVEYHPHLNVHQLACHSSRKLSAAQVKDVVEERSQRIGRIEDDMVLINDLFQELEFAITKAEPTIEQVEKQGERATEHAKRGVVEMEHAVTSARAARRKIWWCFGLLIILLLVVVIVVVVVVVVFKRQTSSNKG